MMTDTIPGESAMPISATGKTASMVHMVLAAGLACAVPRAAACATATTIPSGGPSGPIEQTDEFAMRAPHWSLPNATEVADVLDDIGQDVSHAQLAALGRALTGGDTSDMLDL